MPVIDPTILQAARSAVVAARQKPNPDVIKSYTQPGGATTGLAGYDLEAPSKKLIPWTAPLVNSIPRVTMGYGTQANWRAVTGVKLQGVRAGVSEGGRGQIIDQLTKDYNAVYKSLGVENYVTMEADLAATGYEDVKSLAATQTLLAHKVLQEAVILGGNTSLPLGITPTPTASAGAGGSLTAGVWSVICAALTSQAYWDVAGINTAMPGQSFSAATSLVRGQITRTLPRNATDTVGSGTAGLSAAATATVSAGGSVAASLPGPLVGAYAYAWFFGPAGQERLHSVTTVPTNTFTATAPTGAQLASAVPNGAADNSTNAHEHDGLLTIAATNGSGSYRKYVGGALSGAGGGIAQIDDMLGTMYDQYLLSPTKIYMHWREMRATRSLVMGQANPNITFFVDPQSPGDLTIGKTFGRYVNPITAQIVVLEVHPNMVPGTMLAVTDELPAYVQGVGTVMQIKCRRDYYQIEWPLNDRRYEYGVYTDQVLQHYFPPSLGVITGIVSP